MTELLVVIGVAASFLPMFGSVDIEGRGQFVAVGHERADLGQSHDPDPA